MLVSVDLTTRSSSNAGDVRRPDAAGEALPKEGAVEPAPNSTRKLETYIKEADPLTGSVGGAVGGPLRIYYGFKKLVGAEKPSAFVEGLDHLATGTFSTVSGSIGILGDLGAVSSHLGWAPIAAGFGTAASVLGGTTVAGYLGGIAALLKGGTDLVLGTTHHDRPRQIAGAVKLSMAGLMLTGAITSNPVLVAVGTSGYLTTAVVRSRKTMTVGELGMAAAIIAGTATASPGLVTLGTTGYVIAAGIHNRELIGRFFHHVHTSLGSGKDEPSPRVPASGTERSLERSVS